MKNTDTPSIERLKELLAKASPSLIGGNLKPHVIADLLRRGAETQVPRARDIGATNFEADGLLITELLNNLHAFLRALATLETLPSAGEGVERIVGEGSEYKTLEDFCDALFREEDERKLDMLIGEAVTIMQALAAENARLSARPSFDKWDYARAVLKDSEGCGE